MSKWTAALGKLGPNEQDSKWFGDIRQAMARETADRGTYNGGTNWCAPWYLDRTRVCPDMPTPQHTVLSVFNPDPGRPG